MGYVYKRIETRQGWIWWAARPVKVHIVESSDLVLGLQLKPAEWRRGLSRKHAIKRTRKWAKRQNLLLANQ